MESEYRKTFARRVLPAVIATLLVWGAVFSVFALGENSRNSQNYSRIKQEILNVSSNSVVLINETLDTQEGFKTLWEAMNAIGEEEDSYTIVFVKDYKMVATTDQNALLNNAKKAEKLNFTSSYLEGSTGTDPVSRTVTISNSACSWNFNAPTTIENFKLKTSTAINMLGWGHDFTIGDNVEITGDVRLYGGGGNVDSVSLETDTNIVVNSGNFKYVMGGNLRGKLKGNTNVTIQGTAVVNEVYAGSHLVGLSSGSTGTVSVDGSQGAKINTLIAPSMAANGFASGDRVDVYLNDIKNLPLGAFNNKSMADSYVHVTGDCQITNQVIATDLEIADNAVLRLGSNAGGTNAGTASPYKGILTLSGDLTIGENAEYIHGGSGTQEISGNLNASEGAMIQFFKESDSVAPVKLTVGGTYVNSGVKLNLGIYNKIAAADGDVLITYLQDVNANKDNYADLKDTVSHSLYTIKKNGADILLMQAYSWPTYYHTVDGIADLFYYDEVGTNSISDGENRKIYRKYDRINGKWYPCDEKGNITGTDEVDHTSEHPQPDSTYYTDVNVARATMIRLDGIGRFRITAAVGTNANGYKPPGNFGSASGFPETQVNIDNKGKDNASWANLKKTNENCTIYRAFLVMSTTMSANLSDDKKVELLNKPMVLEGPSGKTMLSNGYLPENFKVAIAGDGAGNLTSNVPTILTDYWNNNKSLGEAMTITDVTDFVRSEGYGKYYGIDIPTAGSDPDTAIAWRLIVIEEDEDMTDMRKTALQFGPITNSNSSKATEMEVFLDKFKTPSTGDFGGQILLIGSDNTAYEATGGIETSNVRAQFYPDYSNKDEVIHIGINDPNTIGIDRPEDNWSQGIMDINGVRLTKDEVSHMTEAGGTGIDMSLEDVTNTVNSNWKKTGGTNLYLTHNSSSVGIANAFFNPTYIGYIDTIGLSTTIGTPIFESEITHMPASSMNSEDKITAGEPVIIKATVTNITGIGNIQGSFNTKVTVYIDDKLSNIRAEDDGDVITAVFHDHDEETGEITDRNIVGVYDAEKHIIVFDFGSDNEDFPKEKLYNSRGDSIDISFKADTDFNAEEDEQYINRVIAEGKYILRDNEVVNTPSVEYTHAEDDFYTYKGGLIFTKTVTGDDIDVNKTFSFVVKLKNSNNEPLAMGTKLKYTGSGGEGELTVNEKGEISFNLKHDENILIKGVPKGSFEAVETGFDGYNVSWSSDESLLLKPTTEGSTGKIFADNIKSTKTNFYNEKVPGGSTIPSEPVYGDLIISKTVNGENADKEKNFSFEISFSGNVVDGTYSGVEIKDGKGIFTLKSGESITFNNIIAGTTYTVTEAKYDDWTADSYVKSGVISSGEKHVDFINTYEKKLGNLSVKKNVDKKVVVPGDTVTYTFEVSNNGEGKAENIYIEDYIREYTFLCQINDEYGRYKTEGDKEYVYWNIDTIAPGETIYLSFTVLVDKCIPKGTKLSNVALYSVSNTENHEPDEDRRYETNEIIIPVDDTSIDNSTVNGHTSIDGTVPGTGDENYVVLWGILLGISFTTFLAMWLILQRRKKNIH